MSLYGETQLCPSDKQSSTHTGYIFMVENNPLLMFIPEYNYFYEQIISFAGEHVPHALKMAFL